ncbi:putative cell wall-binding protein [Glaciihabitans tibetensis]|uniref:Putative cell wall-binding protein n=1 Tax=Glaciihabitans tibetensis TaxID=1266600 RepID=A0A2T0VFB7_9MICO|nr:cell wall-binding repeat-containing protein [Glaciihabitans tibetensis]PRY68881.1 putative cell wall-binding protein [Glaciihabitans tibetensis]
MLDDAVWVESQIPFASPLRGESMLPFRSVHAHRGGEPGGAPWRRSAFALLAAVALVAGMFTVTDAAPAHAAAGVVTGTVTGTNGAPLAGISVMLVTPGALAKAPTVLTSASGAYSIDLAQLDAGEYTLWVSHWNNAYIGEYWAGVLNDEQATYFSLSSTSIVTAKNFTLARPALVSGTVTGAIGSEPTGTVTAHLIDAKTGARVNIGATYNGRYDLAGTSAGTYKLYFEAEGLFSSTFYAGQYWGGATTLEDASEFTVLEGEQKSGFNATLIPGAHLSGRVTAEGTGAPVPNVTVGVIDSDGIPMGSGSVRTDTDGYYTFRQALRQQTFTLKFGTSADNESGSFVSEYWDNQRFESSSTPLVVAGSNAVVANTQLAVGGSVSGSVDLSSVIGSKLYGTSTAYAFDSVSGGWVAQNSSRTSAGGKYTIPGLAAGTYRIGFEAYSSGISLGRGFFDDASSVESASDVKVIGTADTPHIDITVAGDVSRLAGADRFDASASISRRSFEPGVEVAYVANGLNFPDALSGAPVAAQAGAPILLTLAGEIPASIKAELGRVKPGRIVVLGGVNSVSEAVKTQLDAYTAGTVTRLAGADRFAASAAISAESFRAGVATAYVANGLNFPDALAGAPVAAKDGSPILLVTPDAIPGAIEAELKRLKPGRIVVLGGVNSVTEAVKSKLGALTVGGVTRLAGADRFSASADISAKNFAPNADVVYITNGLNFPDALSGAPVAGRDAAPILLVAPNTLPESIAAELTRLKPAKIVILGGVNSVSPAVAAQLQDYTVTPAQ